MKFGAKKKTMIVTIFLALVFIIGGFVLVTMVNDKLDLQTAYVYTKKIDGTSNRISDRIIQKEDIQEIQIQKGSIPENAALDKDEIIGKTVNTIVYPQTYVYTEQINAEDEDVFGELYKNSDIGKLRTCTVEMSLENALGGNLKPGDRVDLTYLSTKDRVKENEQYESNQETQFTYNTNFLEDVWVYKVQTQDGYKYNDYTDKPYEESKEDYEPLALITFIGDKKNMLELQNRAKTDEIAVLGRLAESENYTVPSHVIGDYTKVFTGFAEVETSKMTLEKQATDTNKK